jgi:hypothetical protein
MPYTNATPLPGPHPFLSAIPGAALRLLLDAVPGERHAPGEVLAVAWPLLSAAGMTSAHVQSLMAAGLVVHRTQVKGPATSGAACRGAAGLALTGRSRLALTEAGVAVVAGQLSQAPPLVVRCGDQVAVLPPPVLAQTPRWDTHSGELRYGGQLVKSFRRDAHTQRKVLDTFEAAAWATRIENPLAGTRGKRRLRYTIEGLHEGQRPLVLRFRADGRGGVTWGAVK